MSNSAYATIFKSEIAGTAKVLFLRRSNGEWWLPGGAIPKECTDPKEAMYQWSMKHLGHWDLLLFGIGLWHLSPAAGGHAVHLYGSHLSTSDSIKIRDTTSGLTTDLAWFTPRQIQLRLYDSKVIPWGQAKMAAYSYYELYDKGERSNGEQLKDDLGVLGREPAWKRPR